MRTRMPVLAAVLSLASLCAWAVPRVFEPVQDTTIFFGSAFTDNTADGKGDFLWVSTTAEGVVRRALLKFDLSSLPPGTTVRQARLSVYESRSRTDHVVALHRLTQAWGEGASNGGAQGHGAQAQANDATWVNRFHPGSPWQTPGGTFVPQASAQTVVGQPNERFYWGSTAAMVADVQAWLNQPSSNHGWVLIGDEVNSQSAKRFESLQNSAVANRPRLELEVDLPAATSDSADVPLPAWALGLAAVGLGLALRMRGDKGR